MTEPAEQPKQVRVSSWAFVAVAVALLLALYVGSYVSLSANGRYEPGGIGTNGVKDYMWAPLGFNKNYRWNSRLMTFYCPLYLLDRRFWHGDDDISSGKYPVDYVDKKDIGKVFRAYMEPDGVAPKPGGEVEKKGSSQEPTK